MDQCLRDTACTQEATVYPSLIPCTAKTTSRCQPLAPEETRDSNACARLLRDIAQEHLNRGELARFPRVSEPLHVDLVLKRVGILEKLLNGWGHVDHLLQRVIYTRSAPRQSLVVQAPDQIRELRDSFGEAVRGLSQQMSEAMDSRQTYLSSTPWSQRATTSWNRK